jgi:branched-chain amino acid transport system substrate-binding protein
MLECFDPLRRVLLAIALCCACLPVKLESRRCDTNNDCIDGYSCREQVCVSSATCTGNVECDPDNSCVFGTCTTANPSAIELRSADCPSFIGDDVDVENIVDVNRVQLVATLLPLTKGGLDNSPGRNRVNAIALATRQLNEAGGVFGRKLVWLSCNSDGDEGTATRAMRHIANSGIAAVVGEAASGITTTVFTDVAHAAGILMVAPSSTSVNLTGIDDDSLLFRTTVSDIRQGEAIAKHLLMKGYRRIALLASNEVYASTLRISIRAVLCDSYPCANADRHLSIEFPTSPSVEDVDASLVQLQDFDPDVIVLVGQDVELGPFLTAIAEQPRFDGTAILLTDTAKKDSVLSNQPRQLTNRVRGTAPAAESTSEVYNDFVSEMNTVFPGPIDGFAAHAYDAAVVVGLAHLAHGDRVHPRGGDLAAAIPKLAAIGASSVKAIGIDDNNRNALQAGMAVLVGGGTIDLVGASGPLDFDSNGDVLGDIELWRRCETGNGDAQVSLGVLLSASDVVGEVNERCPSCSEVGCPGSTSCVDGPEEVGGCYSRCVDLQPCTTRIGDEGVCTSLGGETVCVEPAVLGEVCGVVAQAACTEGSCGVDLRCE